MRTMRRSGATATVDAASPVRAGGQSGVPVLVIGLALLAFFLICLMTQVETNEAFINLTGAIDVYRPNWSVFLQIPLLVLGQMSVNQTPGVIFGWGIELLYLAFTIAGYELIHHSVHQAGRVLGILFEVIALGAVFFNWYTDYQYGTLGSGSWGHVWFATMTAFVVGYFGTIGWFLLRYGWSRL